jgi:hypothetical protein
MALDLGTVKLAGFSLLSLLQLQPRGGLVLLICHDLHLVAETLNESGGQSPRHKLPLSSVT